jgi:hypothetical protein
VPPDDELKAAVLAAALVRAPTEGFSPAMLARARTDAGVAAEQLPHDCALLGRVLVDYGRYGHDAAFGRP